jgi:hypothetical protein
MNLFCFYEVFRLLGSTTGNLDAEISALIGFAATGSGYGLIGLRCKRVTVQHGLPCNRITGKSGYCFYGHTAQGQSREFAGRFDECILIFSVYGKSSLG